MNSLFYFDKLIITQIKYVNDILLLTHVEKIHGSFFINYVQWEWPWKIISYNFPHMPPKYQWPYFARKGSKLILWQKNGTTYLEKYNCKLISVFLLHWLINWTELNIPFELKTAFLKMSCDCKRNAKLLQTESSELPFQGNRSKEMFEFHLMGHSWWNYYFHFICVYSLANLAISNRLSTVSFSTLQTPFQPQEPLFFFLCSSINMVVTLLPHLNAPQTQTCHF